jgi:hypothetical protein
LITSVLNVSAQTPTDPKKIWHPIGCIFENFSVEGITDRDLGWSFSGDGIPLEGGAGRIKSVDISALVKQMTSTVGVDLDVRYIDSPGFGLKAFAERQIAKDGSIVMDLKFIQTLIGSRNGWEFFRATVAHEIGHFIVRKSVQKFRISVSETFMVEVPTSASSYTITKRGEVPLSDMAREELICDVWAGYVFASNNTLPPVSTLRAIVIRWEELGDSRTLQDRSHGAPLTRGELFRVGLDFENLARKGYKSVKISGIDNQFELFVAVDDKILAYCNPADASCKW